MANKTAKYSTWIRKSKIVQFWALFFLLFLLGLILGSYSFPLFTISLFSLPFLYIAIVVSLTAYWFSDTGGRFQNKIHERILESLKPEGRVLDIGCGSGKLLIKIAKRYPGSHVGLDYWGKNWEYSKTQCETNAAMESVSGLTFLQGSASSLPFSDFSMENVVSCLTFHEVSDVADKTRSIVEALRVLRKGGRFSFFDLFEDPQFYQSLATVQQAIVHSGGKIESISKLRDLERLPFPLNDAKALKYAVLMVGSKE